MADLQRKHFVGMERKFNWKIADIEPGQFITFMYRSKGKESKWKRRFLLVLGYKFVPKNMQNSDEKIQMISGIDFRDMKSKPYKVIDLFKQDRLKTDVKITTVDQYGFRFFQLNIVDPKLAYKRLESYLSNLREFTGKSLYKTFNYKKMKGKRIQLYNPKFPTTVIRKFKLLNQEEFGDYMYED